MKNSDRSKLLTDVKYICKTSTLITESLRNGCDVAQLANGDIIITEVKVCNTQYSWNEEKGKLIRSTSI